MNMRMKAIVRREKNDLMKHVTNEFAQIDEVPKEIFSSDLGQPEPHKLRGMKLSQQTFSIGSSLKMTIL